MPPKTKKKVKLKYGQSFTDTAGRTGTVKFDTKTGKRLKKGGSTYAYYGEGKDISEWDTPVVPETPTESTSPEIGGLTEGKQVQPEKPDLSLQATPFAGGKGIVDTLNQAGQASDFASRTKMAGQYGIQGYTGTASQNNLLKQKWQDARQKALAGGQASPTSGAGQTVTSPYVSQQPEEPETSPEVDNFYSTDPQIKSSMDEVLKWLSPPETTKSLEQFMKAIVRDQKEMAGLKLELADVERIMDGTDQDIRDEVTKAGGFATESQVAAMTVGRNKELLKRASVIQNQMTYMQDVINSNMTMYGFQKEMASQQFQQRSFLLNYKMQNDERIYRANQDAVKNQLSLLGADGLYNATRNDPVMLDRVERTLGLPSGSLATAASQAAKERSLATRTAEANLSNTYSLINERNKKSTSTSLFNTSPTDTYAIQQGEDPYNIAQQYGVSMEEFKKLNPQVKDWYNIKPGATLNVPSENYETLKDPFVQKLVKSKGGKPMADTSIQKLDKGLVVLSQLGVLQENINGTDTGPIVGAFRGKNPWDTNAQVIKAQLNAIVPNLARGVYGEVGVLTDNDIKNYAKTLPTLTSTEQVRDAVLYITLDTIGRSIRQTMSTNASAGRDVSGFIDIYTEMENTKRQILSSINSSGTALPGASSPEFKEFNDWLLNNNLL